MAVLSGSTSSFLEEQPLLPCKSPGARSRSNSATTQSDATPSTSAGSDETPGSLPGNETPKLLLPEFEYPSPLIVRNTFIDYRDRSPCSMLDFLNERLIKSCPASGFDASPGVEPFDSQVSEPEFIPLKPDHFEADTLPHMGSSSPVDGLSCFEQLSPSNWKDTFVETPIPDHLGSLADSMLERQPTSSPGGGISFMPCLLPVGNIYCSMEERSEFAGAQEREPATWMNSPAPVAGPDMSGLSARTHVPQQPSSLPAPPGLFFATAPNKNFLPPPPPPPPPVAPPTRPAPAVFPRLQAIPPLPPPPAQAPQLRLAEALSAEPAAELPSLGSIGHHNATCRPCAFIHTRGCANGKKCVFCHLCSPGEKKRRMKLGQAAVKISSRLSAKGVDASVANAAAALWAAKRATEELSSMYR